MTTANKAKNSLRKNVGTQMAKNTQPGMRDIVNRMKPEITNALKGTALAPERFTRLVLSTISSNPKLQQCTPESFCAAMMSSAQLGLEPNTSLGQAYLIPYGNQCQFQLGYRGLIDLAYRSGQIKKIDAQVVYKNDEFDYELGWDAKLVHKPAMSNRGDVVGYYALFKLDGGGGNFLFMSKEDIENHAKKFSQAYKSKSSPWHSDFDSMAKKTVIKQLLKYAPIAVELQQAIASDETVKNIDIDTLDEVNVLEVPAEYEIQDELETDKDTSELEKYKEELENQPSLFDGM